MTNEGDVLGLVRLRYPLSVRFDFGYNRHILERGCEGEVPLATCGILLHSTALRCFRCGTNKRKVELGLPHARANVLLEHDAYARTPTNRVQLLPNSIRTINCTRKPADDIDKPIATGAAEKGKAYSTRLDLREE